MKNPLSFQTTSYDCAPTSLINAISYLYEREDIPVGLIKGIYNYSLDCFDEDGNIGHGGTSREAISLIVNWLNEISSSYNFKIKCHKLEASGVLFSKIKNALDKDGVALIRTWQGSLEHYVIITKIDENDVYLFDPFFLPKDYYDKDEEVKMIFNQPFNYNRIITKKRFLTRKASDFALGQIKTRECVLIMKK